MRVVALLAVYNEERVVAACLDHLIRQGVEVYVIDNGSDDGTRSIAERYVGHGVIGIEHLPREGTYTWRPILERKEQLATELEGDWFLHVDADEIRLPPRPDATLAEAFAEATRRGFNAVNFVEFTFVPTEEEADHDHPRFQETMCWYYPFAPRPVDRLNAWARQERRVDLAQSGGHVVCFPGLRKDPVAWPMRHYLFLSRAHAVSKYVQRQYDAAEVAQGWHRARARLAEDMILLPSQSDLRPYSGDHTLDGSNPRTLHYLFDPDWASAHRDIRGRG